MNLTPEQTAALLQAARAQMADDGHTHDCNHLRATWSGIECCGPCQLLRLALAMIGEQA